MMDLIAEYDSHLKKKKDLLKKIFQLEGTKPVCSEIIPTPILKGFRSRMKCKIINQKNNVQFRGTDPRYGDCPVENVLWILPLWSRNLVHSIMELLNDGFREYRIDGFELRLAHGRHQAHVNLSVNRHSPLVADNLAEKFLSSIPELSGVSIPSQKTEYGDPFLKHFINGIHVLAHYRAFFQSNCCLTESLIETVKQCIPDLKCDRIIDLYCGVGLFSLVINSRSHFKILGADNNPYCIMSAEKNLEGLSKSQFHYFHLTSKKFLKQHSLKKSDFVIINPSRSGCSSEVLLSLSNSKPAFICSVSCCPETQVKDINFLLAHGYNIEFVKAFDMFPFTKFMESIVLLQRNL